MNKAGVELFEKVRDGKKTENLKWELTLSDEFFGLERDDIQCSTAQRTDLRDRSLDRSVLRSQLIQCQISGELGSGYCDAGQDEAQLDRNR